MVKATKSKPVKRRSFSKADLTRIVGSHLKNVTSMTLESVKIGSTVYDGSSLREIKFNYKTK